MKEIIMANMLRDLSAKLGLTGIMFIAFAVVFILAIIIGLVIKYSIATDYEDEPLGDAKVLDRYRGLAIRIGFVLTFLVLLFLFNFKVYERNTAKLGDIYVPEDIEVEPPPTKQEKPKPPPPVMQVQEVEELPEEEEQPEIEETEATEETVVEEPPPPEPEPVEEEPLVIVEEMPEFPGGEEALINYVYKNFQYPKECEEIGAQGTIVVNFVVEKDGSVSNIRILRGIDCEAAHQEAIRVVKSMPKWKPGRQQGRPVRVYFNLPIRVIIQ
ncbi:MAG: energy transducer TonB [Chlorobi bacterium]|nr:energy transducer TonB [Chlorobiota bacterium]